MKEKLEEVTKTVAEEPKVDNTVEKIKIKKKPSMKKFSNDTDSVTKIDLSKTPKTEDAAVQEETTASVQDVGEKSKGSEEETQVEVSQQEEKVQNEEVVLEEITDEEEVEVEVEATQEQVDEAIAEAEATGKPIPENIQKLMDFMEETGGDLNDYVKLNQDYSTLNDEALLKEYYTQTKPH